MIFVIESSYFFDYLDYLLITHDYLLITLSSQIINLIGYRHFFINLRNNLCLFPDSTHVICIIHIIYFF